MNTKLEEYHSKRNFTKTTEPQGSGGSGKTDEKRLFVIQKHAASSLHYDFRIETDGVLKSWAVPKGPSTDPRVKRLALPTEDHPLEYADFEGQIPEGQYGAGSVIIWDRGTYTNLTEKDGQEVPVDKALESGHLAIRLQGEKISGGYALHRTGKGSDKRWLLVKMSDEMADARRNPVSTEPESVVSGKKVEEISEE
ncbi:MAG: DNA polymerase ligase N-terminal domain-containing protein [Desulfovibrionales bacterium]